MDQLPPLPLAPCTGLILGVGQKPVPPPSPQAKPTALAAARPVGKRQVPGSVALATTGRRVSRPSFCGGERCCRGGWCCCAALLVFSCGGRLGTLAAAASPQTKPPAGVVAAHGCPPTPARTANPATPPRPSGDLGSPWLPSVCWRDDASAGSRRESPTPKWTGNGTQITYANPRSS